MRPHERLHDAVAPAHHLPGRPGAAQRRAHAVEAVSELTARSPGLQPSLTVVGSGHPKYEARLRRLADDGSHAGRIRFTGGCGEGACRLSWLNTTSWWSRLSGRNPLAGSWSKGWRPACPW